MDMSSDAVMTDTASLDFRNTQPLHRQQEDDQLSKRARADVCDAWGRHFVTVVLRVSGRGMGPGEEEGCMMTQVSGQSSKTRLDTTGVGSSTASSLSYMSSPGSARKSPPNERRLDQDKHGCLQEARANAGSKVGRDRVRQIPFDIALQPRHQSLHKTSNGLSR